MSTPEFVVCLECETACYFFEWKNGEAVEILCEVCGNDQPDQFATSEDLEEMETE